MEMPNDIDGLQQLVIELLARVEKLEAENARLKIENAELRERLGRKSHNSHQPPSADGLSKKSALPPKKKGNNQGGQFGHRGKTLEKVANPDRVVVHHAAHCECCQRKFALCEVGRIVAQRQVFEIPEPTLEVIEHQLGEIVCCGRKQYGEFPQGVGKAAQYGERIKSLSVMLSVDYRLPLAKIKNLLGDLFGCQINQSTIINGNRECFELLEPIAKEIRERLTASETNHYDETGVRVAGKLNWLHVASNRWWTHLFVHEKRGSQALVSEESVIKDYFGKAVHDCYASYFQFENCRHIICNAHLLRELERLKEGGRRWAAMMQKLIYRMYQVSGGGEKQLLHQERWEKLYERICHQGEREEPPPEIKKKGKPKNSSGRNLINRLKKYQAGILAYAFEKEVPFTNNQAERDVRNVKVKQKISNSFRKKEGADDYARIQGFISTLRKQEMDVFQELVNVFNNRDVSFSVAR